MHIEHIALYVTDLEAARTFFERYLGATSNARYHNPRTGFSSYFLTFGDDANRDYSNGNDADGKDANGKDANGAGANGGSAGEAATQSAGNSGARLEIMTRPDIVNEPKPAFRTGYNHIAFSLGSRERVDELTARLRKDGYEVMSGPRVTGDGYYESCIVALENNLIELTV
ncbi:MAG: VOC family protein [Bifidobacteriaceae bacterium]|nr:VOC family protein [Bifidobacteriaceae bacterium]